MASKLSDFNADDGDNGNGYNSVYYDFSSQFDFRRLMSAIYRSRYQMLAILISCIALGLVATLLMTPKYEATTSIQIDQATAKILGTEDNEVADSGIDSDRFLQTQLDVIRSRSIAKLVADDLDLFGNLAFLQAMRYDPIEEQENLSVDELKREQVLEILLENLDVSLPIDSRIAEISFTSADPVYAARIANSYADNYIRANLDRKFDNSSYAREFLKEQLDNAALRLADSERKALEYARRTRIIDTSGNSPDAQETGGPRSLTTDILVQLNQEYGESVSRRIAAEQKWRASLKQNTLAQADVLGSPVIQKLLEEKATHEAAYQEQLQRRKADFPTVRQAKARIDELDQQIASIASGIKSSIASDYRAALSEEKALAQKLSSLKNESLDEQSKSVQLGIYRREASTNRALYDLLLTRYNELNAQVGVQSNNISLVDAAVTPIVPETPNIPMNMALSILAGLGLSGLFLFGREQIFDIVHTSADIARHTPLPVVGTIPEFDIAEHSITDYVEDRKSAVSEAYSSVRTSLQLASGDGIPKSISFTSTQQGEGKSASCFATALSLANLGKKVLVVDLDLRRPSLHRLFDQENEIGMAELLSNNAAVQDVVKTTNFKNVFFIPSGTIPPSPAELLSSETAVKVTDELKNAFDVVVFDGPPMLGFSDAILVGALVDKMIYVIESGRNHAGNVKAALARLHQANLDLAGILITKYNAKQSGYEYSYAYKYHYDHDDAPNS